MALDPSIILGGRSPNILGALTSGAQAAAATNAVMRDNALAQTYAQHGAGIAAGDQSALNALAMRDPFAAQQAQAGRLQMDATQQRMQFDREEMAMLYEDAKAKAAEYSRTISAQQRAAEAADIESKVQGAAVLYDRGDRQGFEAFLASSGLDPAQFPFEQFPAIAATYIGFADALKLGAQEAPEWQAATPEQAAAYGAQAGQYNTKTGKFDPINPPSGMAIETTPDGGMRLVQGPGASSGSVKFTEGQGKDNVFVTRARGALQKLEPVAGALTSRMDRAADFVPFGLGREVQGDSFQVAQQAGDEYLQAILRKDTGAAITTQEQELYGKTYLPQPGDGPAVLRAKAEARVRAIKAIEAGMSPEQMVVVDRAEIETAKGVAGATRTNSQAPQPGEIQDGFRFKGGNPADPSNWEAAQ
jgi:hypothetical protein